MLLQTGIGQAAGGDGVEGSVLPACTPQTCLVEGISVLKVPKPLVDPQPIPQLQVLVTCMGRCIEAPAAHRS